MDSAYYASLGRSISEGDYLLQVNHMSDKPPLFFYVQALFFQLLGVSESVAVLPSFMGGMMGVGIIYFLGRDLKTPVAGVLASFLYVISPGSVMLSATGLIRLFIHGSLNVVVLDITSSSLLLDGFIDRYRFRDEANHAFLWATLSPLPTNT